MAIMLLTYAAIGVLTYGLYFAFLQKNFYLIAKESKLDDMKTSALAALSWPISLTVLILNIEKRYPLRWPKFR